MMSSKPSSDTRDLTEIAEVYCEGLKPTPLGNFVWKDSVETHVGVTPEEFNFSPAWARAWIATQFKKWEAICR